MGDTKLYYCKNDVRRIQKKCGMGPILICLSCVLVVNISACLLTTSRVISLVSKVGTISLCIGELRRTTVERSAYLNCLCLSKCDLLIIPGIVLVFFSPGDVDVMRDIV